MKRRLLARRPSPAMLVAVVALASSLAGGAVAASLITGDDIKNGSITKKDLKKGSVNTKKVKNETLLAKDFKPGQLPQGAQGPKGDKGDPGQDGADGTSVFASAVPSGQTLRGAWGVGAAATIANGTLKTVVSLPVASPTEITDSLVNADDDSAKGADGDAACTGSAAAPTAPAGKVCLYDTFDTNVADFGGYQISGEAGAQNKFGFTVIVRATAAGSVDARGTWAYTAP